jgi:hypothetical protein
LLSSPFFTPWLMRALVVHALVDLIATWMLGGESAARSARRIAPAPRVDDWRSQQQQGGQNEHSLL